MVHRRGSFNEKVYTKRRLIGSKICVEFLAVMQEAAIMLPNKIYTNVLQVYSVYEVLTIDPKN